MGRHSRRGPVPEGDSADTTAAHEARPGRPGRRRMPAPQAPGTYGPASYGVPPGGVQGYEAPRPPEGTPAQGVPGFPGGTPARGFPRATGGSCAQRAPGGPEGTPAQGVPRFPDGTPAHGSPRAGGGVPGRSGGESTGAAAAQRAPWAADGTPSRGVPTSPDDTPAYGSPRAGGRTRGGPGAADGTPAFGVPQVRGGHPEQREPGGGWGESNGRAGAGTGMPAGPRPGAPASAGWPTGPGVPLPRQRRAPGGGPRQDYLEAFGPGEDDDVFSVRAPRRAPVPPQAPGSGPHAFVAGGNSADGPGAPVPGRDDAAPTGGPASAGGGKGRILTGAAAAALTTVLAVVVAAQVADGQGGGEARAQSATGQVRDARDPASRDDDRPTPAASGSAAPLTYEQKMAKTYPLAPTFKGTGRFDAVPGIDKAPGRGHKYTYRVDVEQGLGLDGELFAQAVQKTLNDNRSWAHNGAYTFERVHSGQTDFVITLASPGTTAEWCAKSGLDTTVDNVSCDSAATKRVMINAYRWAQGAEPYGDDIHGYRQMLINHEVGHRIGHNHVTCDKDGELAPVMQQQTKFVDHDGIDCRPNPWAYPNG